MTLRFRINLEALCLDVERSGGGDKSGKAIILGCHIGSLPLAETAELDTHRSNFSM